MKRWPKKVSVTDYMDIAYAEGGRCRNAVVNDIKRGDLPGIKVGGKWYVYMQANGEPAWGYKEGMPTSPRVTVTAPRTGNALADAILSKTLQKHGINAA